MRGDIEKVEQRHDELTLSMKELLESQKATSDKVLKLMQMVQQTSNKLPGESSQSGVARTVYLPKPEGEFDKFEGREARYWITRCELYFDYYNTPPEEQVLLAGVFLTGEAKIWYHH